MSSCDVCRGEFIVIGDYVRPEVKCSSTSNCTPVFRETPHFPGSTPTISLGSLLRQCFPLFRIRMLLERNKNSRRGRNLRKCEVSDVFFSKKKMCSGTISIYGNNSSLCVRLKKWSTMKEIKIAE